MAFETIASPDPDRLPLDEPEVELLRGIEVPKMSPRRIHGRLQGLLFAIFDDWASTGGEVSIEWRMHLPSTSPEEETTLVPDVAYLSEEIAASLTSDEIEEPPVAPTVAIEIRSPGDRERNVATKIEMYLAAGSQLVLDVDPQLRHVIAHDRNARRRFAEHERFEHPAVPGLVFSVKAVFDRAERKKTRA